MAINYGFFNSVAGDRTYNAEDITRYFDGLISNGVFEAVGDRLIVQAASGMAVNVGTGRAFINCHWLELDTVETLNVAAADVQRDRIDAVVVKLDTATSAREMTLYIKTGELSSAPQPPALTRSGTVYEICLAQIRVTKGATAITQSRITDTRPRTDLCGFVTGIVQQVDTSDLFMQYESYCVEKAIEIATFFNEKQAAFTEWFESLTRTLNVDVTVQKYQNTVYLTAEATTINIGIAQYEPSDILLVHIGGVLFVEGSEFTRNGTGIDASITLANSIRGNNAVTFICLKSVIGAGVVSQAGNVYGALSGSDATAFGHVIAEETEGA